jgi:hypothetical protein
LSLSNFKFLKLKRFWASIFNCFRSFRFVSNKNSFFILLCLKFFSNPKNQAQFSGSIRFFLVENRILT